MIELVVVYCLSADVSRCIEVREAMTEYPTAADCAGAAEFVVQQYVRAHPKWRVDRWRCEIDHPRQEPA